MPKGDEETANKVLETLGLSILPKYDDILAAPDFVKPDMHHPPQQADDLSMTENAPHASSNMQLGFPSDHTLEAESSVNQSWGDSLFTDDIYAMSWDSNMVSPDWPWTALFTSDQGLLPTTEQLAGPVVPANQSSGSGDEDEVDQEVVGEIAARFGSLHVAPDGKLRYFGTPTNVHLFNSGKGPYSSPRSIEVDGAQLLRNAELERDIPPDIEQHLLELYFAWHNACNPVVSEDLFWTLHQQRGQSKDNSGYYSDVLTNAM